MGMSERLKNITKEDWRMLGFYYDRDDFTKKWIFIGSKNGLEQFAINIEKYAINIKNSQIGEHDHIGPYSYLKIMTSDTFKITKNSICGSLNNLLKLSEKIKEKIKESKENDVFAIDSQFCEECEYSLEFSVKEYGYDPALSDKQLWE